MLSPHLRAVLQALFVTFLWATSWVLIKIGLREIPALPFAGLRYSLAFLVLLPFVLRPAPRTALRGLARGAWARLFLLGLLFYALTQGAQFLALAYLPSVTVSLLLNFSTVAVALLGIVLLREQPSGLQWAGVGVALLGAIVYFYPVAFARTELLGLVVAFVAVFANAGSAVFGRSINRGGRLPALAVTAASMGAGSLALLAGGLLVQGVPRLDLGNWLIVAWLAVVNTAFAFTLWNQTLRILSAVESSIINGTMLVQIAVLAWIFLGERLTPQEILGMILVGAGALIVQFRSSR